MPKYTKKDLSFDFGANVLKRKKPKASGKKKGRKGARRSGSAFGS